MGYAELLPSPALQPLVACAWAISGPGRASRILPDGCIDILLVGDASGRARVVGTMTRAIVVPALDEPVLGIRFRPGEAARLLPAVPRELTDGEGSLRELWGSDAHALEDALGEVLARANAAACSAEQILAEAQATIEASLRARLASHGEAVDVRVRAAVELLKSGRSVRETAARVELSERQLARRFTERVGIAPKKLARVMRLQRAAALLYEGASAVNASSLAGYTDQAHFTRDSVELAGITPAGLGRELTDSYKTTIAVAS